MYLCLLPSWDLVMQEGRECKCSLSLSVWLWLEVVAARSSSWHRTGVRSGSGSSCSKIELLMRKEYLGPLGGNRGFLTRQLCWAADAPVPGSSASSLALLWPLQPLQVPQSLPNALLFCSALCSQYRGLPLGTLPDTHVEWNAYITPTWGMTPDVGALVDLVQAALGHLLVGGGIHDRR